MDTPRTSPIVPKDKLESSLFRDDPKLQACLQFDFAHVQRGSPPGEYIRRIQRALNKVNNAGINETGTYDKATEEAVLRFKASRGIRNFQSQIDAIVGRKTITALDDELLQRPSPLMALEERVFIIICVDANGGTIITKDLPLLSPLAGWNSKILTVTSVRNMVSRTLGEVTGEARIARMFVTGHGRSGGQAVGGGLQVRAGNVLALNAAILKQGGDAGRPNELAFGAASELAQLAGKFLPTAVFRLLGCHVGADPHGPLLCRKVSEALGGVKVRAGSGLQDQPCSIVGPAIECTSAGCRDLAAGSDEQALNDPSFRQLMGPGVNGRLA